MPFQPFHPGLPRPSSLRHLLGAALEAADTLLETGDLLVRVVVWVPDRLSVEQERIIRDLESVEDPPPEKIDPKSRRGFWSKVKEALG